MLHILYLFFIAPLEFLMRLVLEWGFSCTHSWGWSLVLLSLAVNMALLPITSWAESRREAERERLRSMARHEAMLRECFRGQDRFALLSAMRRVGGYHWSLALRSSVGLLVQIPFFIAAWHLLSAWTPFSGRGFGLLADLSAPDGLLRLGGVEINILPFVMTAANLLAAFVYARDLARRDRFQIYGIALLFLVLLYAAPSALVLYWTLNNLFSLGKNLVSNRLARREVSGGIRKPARRSERSSAEGTPKHHFARLLMATRISFCVGAIFWLYIATVALKGHYNLLDGDLRSAVWRLAGQCALTAFWAAALMFALAPSHPKRKYTWRPSCLVASVVALFLLQFKLFRHGLAVEQGHFLADMWDGEGGLCFFLWGFALYGFGKFKDRLNQVCASASWRAPARTGARLESEKPSAPSGRGTFVLACLMGTTCGIFLWYFIPFCTYFRNPNEFGFNGWELFRRTAPGCLLTTFCATSVLMAASWILPTERVTLPWKRSADGKANIVYALVLAFLFLLWLEGGILSYGLPQLDGAQGLFDSKNRMLLDTSIWMLILLSAVRYWRILVKNLLSFLLILILVASATLYEWFTDKVEKIDVRTFAGIEGLALVDKETLFSSLQFSRTNNIIIFLVDSLDTLAFEKTLEVYPELEKVFEGFSLFRENLGAGGVTPQALPQILAGEVYNRDTHGAFSDFVQNALVGESSLAADALYAGRKIFIDANFWNIQKNDEQKTINTVNNENGAQSNDILRIVFRFFPYCCKHILYNRINVKSISESKVDFENHENSEYLIGDDRNKEKFNMLIHRLNKMTDDPVLQFIWFFGVHSPYTKGDIIETTKEYITDFSHFINLVKIKGIYNKTTFILMADHGMVDHRRFYPERNGRFPTIFFPILMVKPKDASIFQTKDDLTSSTFVREMIKSFYSNDDTLVTMNKFLEKIPEVRTVFRPGLGTFEAKGKFDSLSFHRIDKRNEKKLYDNVVYTFNEFEEKFSFGYHDVSIIDDDADTAAERSFGGFSVGNINLFKLHVKFLYAGAPNTRKRVTFQISSFTGKGKIDIMDAISGNSVRWDKNGNIEILCTVDEEGFINIVFSPVVSQSSVIHYMVIQDENDAPPEFPPLRK